MTRLLPCVTFRGIPGVAAAFLPLLREGVRLRARTGMTLRRLMEEVLGMAPAYAQERVLAVLLDGSPVDDIDRAEVRAGAEIGLGAALPGPAGKTGGAAAGLEAPGEAEGDAPVLVKLFHLVADEAGPEVLRRGVGLTASRLTTFLSAQPDGFWHSLRGLEADGLAVSSSALVHGLSLVPGRALTLCVIEERP